MSDVAPEIHSVTEGGIAATHIPLPAPLALVAPATSGKEHNTVKNALIPFACWRAHDMRFKFDSSFVLPGIKDEIKALKELIDNHTLPDETGAPKFKPVLSVFGHADPVGSDDYNKTLSGKRAQAIYAMLVRNVDLWDDLYNHPQGNDKWEPEVINAMQTELNQPLSTNPSTSERKALYQAYMDHVCTVEDENGQLVPFQLQRTDFLAQGKDSGGKGDYQGCSEFNPVLIFSEQQDQDFSAPEKKDARDAANAPNRRVLIFLFRPGMQINPSNWPCPRAKEGADGCKKRFWSDGEKRRSTQLPDKERKYEDTHDTFACRFYDRLSNKSPCEVKVKTFHVRLYTPMGRAIPHAQCEITIGNRKPLSDQADARGIITLRDVEVPDTCKLRWGFSPDNDQEIELIYSLDIFLKADEPGELGSADASKKMLNNLGYISTDPVENVRWFQRDYRQLASPALEITGVMDERATDVLTKVYRKSADDLKNTQVGAQ